MVLAAALGRIRRHVWTILALCVPVASLTWAAAEQAGSYRATASARIVAAAEVTGAARAPFDAVLADRYVRDTARRLLPSAADATLTVRRTGPAVVATSRGRGQDIVV